MISMFLSSLVFDLLFVFVERRQVFVAYNSLDVQDSFNWHGTIVFGIDKSPHHFGCFVSDLQDGLPILLLRCVKGGVARHRRHTNLNYCSEL